MSKKNNILKKNIKESEVKSIAKYISMSAIKLRRVANEVRGKSAAHAISLLNNMPIKSAFLIKKVIESGMSNAKNNHKIDESLYISFLAINEGPFSKRFVPKARGRIFAIKRKTAHIIVGLDKEERRGS